MRFARRGKTRTLGLMRTVALILLLLVASTIGSWVLTAGMCSVFHFTKTAAFDWVCGHNAFIPLVLFWLAGLILLPMLWGWLRRTPTRKGPVGARCGQCGTAVSFADTQCPQCGFKFGGASA